MTLEIARSRGSTQGLLKNLQMDLTDVFKKGIDEGEINARARNAKKMDSPPALEQEKE